MSSRSLMKRWLGIIGVTTFVLLGLGADARIAPAAEAPIVPDSLDLDTAIRLALARQPVLLSSRARADAARARSGQALSTIFPQVDLSSGYNRASVSTPGIPPSHQYSTGFTFRQRLFDFGVTVGSIRSASKSAQAQEQDMRDTRLQVVLDVEQSYYNYLKTLRLVEVSEEARAQQEAHYKQANAFFTVGTRPKIDVTQAEASLTSAELDLIRARNNARLGSVALARAIGIPETAELKVQDTQDTTAEQADMTAGMAEAERNRPDLRAAEARLAASGADVTSTRGELLPQLTGSADYGWRGLSFPGGENGWNWGVSASMPVFNGFGTVRRVQEAKANRRQSEADLESLRLQVRQDVAQSALNLNVARENLTATRQFLGQAQENFDVAEGRYRAGAGSIIEVADAQLLLTQARTQDVQARYDLAIARSVWNRSLGRTR